MKHRLLLILAALLVAPLALVGLGAAVEAQDANPARPGQMSGPITISDEAHVAGRRAPNISYGNVAGAEQVRIRGRVVIRVSPGTRRARTSQLSELPRRNMRASFAETEHGDCIRARSVIGVQPTNDERLLFFLEDGEVLAARLNDRCNVNAFYAGFYADRSNDGNLCVERNRLHSRAGEMCEVAEFRRIVAVAD